MTAGDDGTGADLGRPSGAGSRRCEATDRVVSAAFSPDGKLVVTAGGDGTARIWDAERAPPLYLRATRTWVFSAAFSPTATVVTVGDDGTARIWDAASGAQLQTLGRRGADVVRAPPSAPTASGRGRPRQRRTARIWDAATGA